MSCTSCGFNNRQDAAFCAGCGGPLIAAPPSSGRNPFIATLLTFLLPAGGQFYNRDYKKAALVLVAYFACILISGTMVVAPIAIVLALGIWAWAILDAYRVAKSEKVPW